MKFPRFYFFLYVNFVTTVVAYYRKCYDSFSLCLITNTDDGSNFRLNRSSADRWCEDHSSLLAIITNETVQSAIQAFVDDPLAKMMDSTVLTNGYRFTLSNWEWLNERQSAITRSVDNSTRSHRYAYLAVSSYMHVQSHRALAGHSYWNMTFICSYVTHNLSCPSGFRQLGSRCYKIYNRTATWYDARSICLKEESDLATFEDGIYSLTSEWVGQYWIGLRKERWYWQSVKENYGEIKYFNWEDWNPDPAGGGCLCLYARTGRWTNCHCSRRCRYICVQGYAPDSSSTVPTLTTRMTTATPKVNTTTTKMTKTTTKLQTTQSKKTSTLKVVDSTSQLHSTPTQTLDDDFGSKMSENSAVTVESGQTSGFLPIIGVGIACLLILIVAIAVIVFIKNRRSRSGDHEPTNGNCPPPMTYKDDAPNTVYAAVIPNGSEPVCSASEENSNQTVYAELDLKPKRNVSTTQRASNPVRFTSENTPSEAVYAEVNCLPKENMNGGSEGPSEYDNIQMVMDSVYANSAQTKV